VLSDTIDDQTAIYEHTAILDPAEATRAAERRERILRTDLDELYHQRHSGSLIFGAGDVGADYVNFALNPEARVGLGYEIPDAVMRGGIAPGEIAILAAGASTGKTTFMANVALNNAHLPIVMASIEMPIMLIAARIFAMAQGETYSTLEERLRAGADNLASRITRELAAAVPHLGLMGVGGPDVELLEKAVAEYQESFGQRPKLVMIDYLDLMRPNSENVENVKRKLVDLRAFAKRGELGVLIAHQVKREILEHRHGQPLRFTDTRYAGETEVDHLICLYRRINDMEVKLNAPLHREHQWTIHIQVLKTRSSEQTLGEIEGHELGWNPETLRITDAAEGLEPIPLGLSGAAQVLTQGALT
jgi:KaiC/GvpD/RAD55 family RecA-like ATPase